MKVKFDNQNYIKINSNNGRIQQVHLHGKTILKQIDQGTGSGNFLMFPWVNRVQENPFLPIQSEYFDGNGIPLHGLYVNDTRQIIISPREDAVFVELLPQKVVQGVPKFKEQYILSKNSLKVSIKVQKSEDITLPFCFGYHPYLEIDNQDLKNLKLKTDIKIKLQLNEILLPTFPYQPQEVNISSDQKYDSLFQGGSFVQLENKAGFHVKISSSLPYWQIYTPPDGKRIAIQPMSFTANVYKISQSGLSPTLSQGSFVLTAWNQ